MKKTFLLTIASWLIASGCATRDVIPIGTNTYMVNRGGWPAMNGFACERACYEAANAFCAKRGLAIASSQSAVVDGEVFKHNASCKLVFVVTNAPPTGTK